MSWLNPWYWWSTPEDDEAQEPVPPKKDYKVLDGIEINTGRVWLCDELLALKKQSLNPVVKAPPPTPEKDKIEKKLKFQKKHLRKKKNYKKRRYEKLNYADDLE